MDNSQQKERGVISGLFWKVLERFGVQGTSFLLQLILARILDPEHYGELSLMIIFITLANVFIQTGFNTSLIQNKEVTEEDYSSVLWISLAISVLLYLVIFFAAPVIAAYYRMPNIVWPLRGLSLVLLPGALNSVQLAKVGREMDFKKVFYSNVLGIVVAGAVGIATALLGGGLWALVVQNLLNVTVACLVMFVTLSWRPRLVCNLKRVAVLFRFGWKLLVSTLLNTLEESLYGLVIGKKYDSDTLAYYNRGMQFPQFIINAICGSLQSVMLPAMSAEQDDITRVKQLAQTSISLSSYLVFPMMAGLASVAEPLIRLLLTEKWLPAVPYLQVNCFVFAFYTVHICNLQTINAMGRSDWFLKLEIIKKIYGFALLAAAVIFFDSPMAVAMTGVVNAGISWYVNAYPNKRLIGYSFWEQVKDLMPTLLIALAMCSCVFLTGFVCSFLKLLGLAILIIQVFVGVAVYLLFSMIFKPYPYCIIRDMVLRFLKKNSN